MSTTAATARYVIAADDKTKAAIASINSGFKNMERGIKSTVRGINTSLGILAGVGIKRAFQSIFTETANSSREFADALADVKMAAKDLLSSEDGAPAATAAMQELAETLKDPALQKAADDLTSTLIRGFGALVEGSAHAVTGLQVLLGTTGDEVENLRREIAEIDAQIEQNKRAGTKSGMSPEDVAAANAILERRKLDLARLQMQLIEGPQTQGGSRIQLPGRGFEDLTPEGNLPGFRNEDLNILSDLTKQMEEFQRVANINPVDHLQEQLGEFVKSFESDINSGVVDTAQRAADSISEIGDKLGEDIIGKAADLSVFAEEAARNMQSAFADFLFDPFQDGLKGMLKGFIDVIRRMIAEAAAAQIFETLFGTGKDGKSGAGSAFGSFLSGLLGFGSSKSGSSGGGVPLSAFLDQFSVPAYASGTGFVPQDQLAMVHKGEAIIPANLNRGVGGVGGVSIVNNIDARGATQESIKALPEIMRKNNEALEARIVQRLKSGRYG